MITYKELSTPLKTAIIGSWIIIGLYILIFIVGFIQGVMTQ